MCVTDRHDMTLAVTVVLNPNTTNQPMYVSPLNFIPIAFLQEICGELFKTFISRTSKFGIPPFYDMDTDS